MVAMQLREVGGTQRRPVHCSTELQLLKAIKIENILCALAGLEFGAFKPEEDRQGKRS